MTKRVLSYILTLAAGVAVVFIFGRGLPDFALWAIMGGAAAVVAGLAFLLLKG